MSLANGTRLGPYEIQSAIGAGGMGEVYRARDTRLNRDVAIKVLAAGLSTDPDRLARFEQEARASAALNHPNICAVFDIGVHDGAPFIVSELLEGETLRLRMGTGVGHPSTPTPVPIRKTIEYAVQIARGLAAAHEKGIVHRDLKPENVFVTSDARVKILDFGLAKLTQPDAATIGLTQLATSPRLTQAGIAVGTVGYMSPEQVRGLPTDYRSDIFSFGTVLFEMVTGRSPFRGDTAADTMSAILREDPPDLSSADQHVPAALTRIIAHCLEKRPEDRFRSANDLAFALEALSGSGATSASVTAVASRSISPRSVAMAAAGVVVALAVGVVAGRLLSQRASASGVGAAPVKFQRLTFRRGNNTGARFAPDGRTIVYGAAWDGRPAELFLTSPEATESRPLGLQNADLLAMSSSSELAVKLKTRFLYIPGAPGTLARLPLTGGAPRAISEDVLSADWSPDGKDLAVVRQVEGRLRVEFPIGRVLRELPGGYQLGVVAAVRVSPGGDEVAVIESNGGTDVLVVVDRTGKARVLARGRTYAGGFSFAWTPDGREIWYSSNAVLAVSLTGAQRVVASGVDWFLHDISRDGRVLVEQFLSRVGVEYVSANAQLRRELSFLDGTTPADLSSDGRTLLFGEAAQGGGESGSVYLRSTDGALPVRLGDGTPQGLSPDGKWALTLVSTAPPGQIALLPTGVGTTRIVQTTPMTYSSAAWFPDGKRLLVFGSEPGHRARGYVQDVDGGTRRALTKEGGSGVGVVSPDGKAFITGDQDGRLLVYSVDGGEPRVVPGTAPGEIPVQWGNDGLLYVWTPGDVPAVVTRIDLKTGGRSAWKTLQPGDSSGLITFASLVIARDGRSYVYSFNRALTSDLYLVEGWK